MFQHGLARAVCQVGPKAPSLVNAFGRMTKPSISILNAQQFLNFSKSALSAKLNAGTCSCFEFHMTIKMRMHLFYHNSRRLTLSIEGAHTLRRGEELESQDSKTFMRERMYFGIRELCGGKTIETLSRRAFRGSH